MPLDTFTPPIPPSPGTSNKPELKILDAAFGDGYDQPTPDGLNHIRRVLSLQWETLTPANCKTITDFLEGKLGTEPFYYTPSDEVSPVRWTCREWNDRRGQRGFRMLSATFREYFGSLT